VTFEQVIFDCDGVLADTEPIGAGERRGHHFGARALPLGTSYGLDPP